MRSMPNACLSRVVVYISFSRAKSVWTASVSTTTICAQWTCTLVVCLIWSRGGMDPSETGAPSPCTPPPAPRFYHANIGWSLDPSAKPRQTLSEERWKVHRKRLGETPVICEAQNKLVLLKRKSPCSTKEFLSVRAISQSASSVAQHEAIVTLLCIIIPSWIPPP